MALSEQGIAPALSPYASNIDETRKLPVSQNQRLAGVLIVVSVAILPLIVSSAFTLTGIDRNESDAVIRYRHINTFLREAISLALVAYVIRQNRQKWADFGLVFRLSDIVFGIVLWLVALCCYSIASPSILSACELLGWHRAAPFVPSFKLPGFLATIYVISSPVFEEIIVRAFVMTETRALTGSWVVAALVSVVLQTSYHFYQGVPYALSAAVLFIIFSAFYARTRRTVSVMLAHFIFDASAFMFHAASAAGKHF